MKTGLRDQLLMSFFEVLRLTYVDLPRKNINNLVWVFFFLLTSSRMGSICCLIINHCICLAKWAFLSAFVNLSHLILLAGEVGRAKDIILHEQMRWLGLLGGCIIQGHTSN